MVTENLFLSAIEEEDKDYLYSWFNDSEFLKFYDYYPPVPQSKEEVDKNMKYYENNERSFIFAIRLKESNQIIGVAGYDDVISENKVATLFIGIGRNDLRGKGYGKEALKLLLDYGFNNKDFHRIQLNVLSFNERAIALYEKAGFVKEGTYREFVLRDNKRYDLYLYGLLKHEWENK
jgi:RimJ/RimL family protein N-acetyltransferase